MAAITYKDKSSNYNSKGCKYHASAMAAITEWVISRVVFLSSCKYDASAMATITNNIQV